MVIDTSALIAILRSEPESESFVDLIEASVNRLMSAASLVEASMILLANRGEDGLASLKRLIRYLGIEIAPVTEEQTDYAVDAFRRYGKGRHPAKLNFGDCFVYALARASDQPLLYKGNDFARTDIG